MKRHVKIFCFLAVLCLFLTRSCDNGLDDLLELQRIMIPVSNEAELRAAIAIAGAPDGSIIGIVNNIELSSRLNINSKNITITAFDKEVILKTNTGIEIDSSTVILGDKRSSGTLILEETGITNPIIELKDSTMAPPITCIMKDGVVLRNTVTTNEPRISVNPFCTFIMEGGIICDSNSLESGSGGVYFDAGTFIMTGGTICGNKTWNNGGGVYVDNGSFEMTGGTIRNNEVTGTSVGGGVYVDNGSFKMTGGTIRNNEVNGTGVGGGGGVYFINGSGDFIMTGGTISSNTAVDYAGGVFFGGPRNFIINGNARITNNKAGAQGGGICLSYYSTLTMSNGTISGNRAGSNGGGVFVDVLCSLNINGGKITGNTAAGYGGGVYLDAIGSISGSQSGITGNFAQYSPVNVYQ